MTERIGVALSGGADSALAASMLLSRGYRVFALHMVLTRSAGSEEQAARAKELAGRLGIEIEVLDAVDVFADKVIAPFCEEYASGRTPNPCVTCNRHIKLGYLLRTALDRGADRLATGHYARVGHQADGYVLQRALDHQADQSYFLYSIDPSALERLLLPLGEVSRGEVRLMASAKDLIHGRSSQDICFVGGRDYRRFVAERVNATPGDIVDTEGRVRGRHGGLPFFTVGQRHHVGLALRMPAYVVRLDLHHNRVVIGTVDDLTSISARLRDVRWLIIPPRAEFTAHARIRYRGRCSPARVIVTGDSAHIHFEEPQRALAPGQSVVLYDGETVLGGGVVSETSVTDGHAH